MTTALTTEVSEDHGLVLLLLAKSIGRFISIVQTFRLTGLPVMSFGLKKVIDCSGNLLERQMIDLKYRGQLLLFNFFISPANIFLINEFSKSKNFILFTLQTVCYGCVASHEHI